MKKSLIYTIVGGACLIASTGLTLIANGVERANAEKETDNSSVQLALDAPVSTTPKSFSSSETVYIITDQSGAQAKSFIGSTINQSSEPIPVELKITYTLDGNEISPSELAHKSGHVKVSYDFSATKYHNTKKIPFLTVTGIMLDTSKFKNVKTKNGKIIEETTDNTLLAGYAMVGLNEDLSVDLLPTSFSFEADTTDFVLETTYTFATNEVFADLDTSKLNSIDDLVGQLNQLSSSFDQIISGSSALTSGLDSALAGGKALQSGLNALTSGASTLASGANDLASGAHALEAGAYQLSEGLGLIVDKHDKIIGTVDSITGDITERIAEKRQEFDEKYAGIVSIAEERFPELAEKLADIKETITRHYDSIHDTVYGTITTYTESVKKLSEGADNLAAGLTKLSGGADSLAEGANSLVSGVNELSLGSNTLVNGLEQLSGGSHTLYNGLITFKNQGINKLTDFANHDLASLTSNIRSTVSAAKSYHYYQNPDAKSVRFIFKTPSIK